MTAIKNVLRPRRAATTGGANGPFMLVIGLLIGVLVSALVFPEDAPDDAGAGLVAGPGDTPDVTGPGGRDAVGDDGTSPGGDGGPATGDGVGGGPTGNAPGGGPAANPGGPTTGEVVTLKIGIGALDLGAIRNLGPAFDNGDGVAHMRAWLEGVRRDGLLPVNGYDLQFVYRRYDVLRAESQRAACRGFVQDDKVLAVLAGSNFQLGAECVAREFRTPLLTSDGVRAAAYRRAPMLFTFMPSQDRLVRNWAHWAHRRGELRGKTIGIFYPGNPDAEQLALRVKGELEDLGYRGIVTAAGSASPVGGPEDAIAAQRFQAEGVDVAFMMASPTAFTQQAEQQRYHPRYLATDYSSGTTNTATSNAPPEQYDGALAMTAVRYGEWKAGLPDPPRAAKCARYYAQASGRRVRGNDREAEWVGMNKLCDGGWALLDALARARPGGLDKAGLAAALEALRTTPLGIHDDATFVAGRHEGARRQRTLRWYGSCRCWKAVGSFQPLFLG